jgi:hypothetical protein
MRYNKSMTQKVLSVRQPYAMLKSTVLYDIASGKLDISVFAERN